jgi:hypothetical protein
MLAYQQVVSAHIGEGSVSLSHHPHLTVSKILNITLEDWPSACCILLHLHFTTSLVTNLNMSRAAVTAHQTGPESQISRKETAYIIMPGIEILLMSQRMEIRDGKEDWTGKSSIAEKRILQNWLNQRAYRTCTYSLRG